LVVILLPAAMYVTAESALPSEANTRASGAWIATLADPSDESDCLMVRIAK